MTILRLSLADENNPMVAYEAEIKELSMEEKQLRCVEMEGRIRSRCCGLLEIHKRAPFQGLELKLDYEALGWQAQAQRSSRIETIDVSSVSEFRTILQDLSERGPHEGVIQMEMTSRLLYDLETNFPGLFLKHDDNFLRHGRIIPKMPHEMQQCKGLLVKSQRDIANYEVQFLHKTVVDFLEQPVIWEDLLLLTSKSDFDPNVALLSSSLLEAKCAPLEINTLIDESSVWLSLVRGFNECALAEISTNKPQDLLLEEFDTVMDYHWRAIRGWLPRYRLPFNESGHWSNFVPSSESSRGWPHGGLQCDSLLSIAASFGLILYVEQSLQKESGTRRTVCKDYVIKYT